MAKSWAKAFYKSRAWQDCRAAYIASVHGLCERCLSHGRYRPGKIVHHTCYLTPDNINDPAVSLNFDNLEYLCQDCHNAEHHGAKDFCSKIFFDENGNPQKKIIPPEKNEQPCGFGTDGGQRKNSQATHISPIPKTKERRKEDGKDEENNTD